MPPPVLTVGAALPDPPFELMQDGKPAGFDIELTQLIAARLGRTWRLTRYDGSDFTGIFDGLNSGAYDCVASGATITPERRRLADFCDPYVVSGQSLVVDAERHPARPPILPGSRSACSRATPVSPSPAGWSRRGKRPG
jgi:polar amino acid transport system substrate-binding protein